MSGSELMIIGSGPVIAIASDVAGSNPGGRTFRPIELSPERIPDADIASMVGRPSRGVDVFAAIGLHALNHARSDLVTKVRQAGFGIATLVHSRAIVSSSAVIGANALVAGGASVGANASLGEGCVILDGARVEAGARVGAYAWIGANVVIGFGCSVGDHSILRPGVHLDAGVSVGHHCELSTPGLRQAAIADRVFETPSFASARILGAHAR